MKKLLIGGFAAFLFAGLTVPAYAYNYCDSQGGCTGPSANDLYGNWGYAPAYQGYQTYPQQYPSTNYGYSTYNPMPYQQTYGYGQYNQPTYAPTYPAYRAPVQTYPARKTHIPMPTYCSTAYGVNYAQCANYPTYTYNVPTPTYDTYYAQPVTPYSYSYQYQYHYGY